MTQDEFREVALSAIRNGATYYGQYIADHNDQTLYWVTRWLNVDDIAIEDYFTRQKDEQEWERHWKRAMLRESTLHKPRAQDRG